MTKNFKLLKTGTCLLFAGILSISLLFEGSVPATAYAKAKDTAVEEESSENSTEKDSSKKDSEQTTGEKNSDKKKSEQTADKSDKKDSTQTSGDQNSDNKNSDKKKSDSSDKVETLDLTEAIVPLSGSRIKADSLNGVSALYRSGVSSSTDGTNATYSCAAFIKKYYSKIYGLELNNMYPGAVPNVVNSDDYFVSVKKPKVGDIVSLPGHWALVKAVEGNQVILIEQNYKWSQGGSYFCRINRRIAKSSATYYRLHSLM